MDQNAHHAIGLTPFVKILQCALNQLEWRHSRSGLDIVAGEYDLPVNPFTADYLGEPWCATFDAIGRTFDRDDNRKRGIGCLTGFHQVHNF